MSDSYLVGDFSSEKKDEYNILSEGAADIWAYVQHIGKNLISKANELYLSGLIPQKYSFMNDYVSGYLVLEIFRLRNGQFLHVGSVSEREGISQIKWDGDKKLLTGVTCAFISNQMITNEKLFLDRNSLREVIWFKDGEVWAGEFSAQENMERLLVEKKGAGISVYNETELEQDENQVIRHCNEMTFNPPIGEEIELEQLLQFNYKGSRERGVGRVTHVTRFYQKVGDEAIYVQEGIETNEEINNRVPELVKADAVTLAFGKVGIECLKRYREQMRML